MISIIKKIFGTKTDLKMIDVDLGPLQYVYPSVNYPYGYWQMNQKIIVDFQDEQIGFSEISGDEFGPYKKAKNFLMNKIKSPEIIWKTCDSELKWLIDEWFEGADYVSPKEFFFISSLALSSDKMQTNGWEVCFETHSMYRWVYYCLQIENNKIISNTIDA